MTDEIQTQQIDEVQTKATKQRLTKGKLVTLYLHEENMILWGNVPKRQKSRLFNDWLKDNYASTP